MNTSKTHTVKDIMSENIISLHPKDKMSRVKEIFIENEISHIPILDDNSIIGIISRSDFRQLEGLRTNSFDEFIKEKTLKLHPVENYMKTEVVCCDISTPLLNVVELFLANAIHSVIVVDDEKMLGIVTPIDLLKLFREYLS